MKNESARAYLLSLSRDLVSVVLASFKDSPSATAKAACEYAEQLVTEQCRRWGHLYVFDECNVCGLTRASEVPEKQQPARCPDLYQGPGYSVQCLLEEGHVAAHMNQSRVWTGGKSNWTAAGPSICECSSIQVRDPRRHFKGCPLCKPIFPEKLPPCIQATEGPTYTNFACSCGATYSATDFTGTFRGWVAEHEGTCAHQEPS